MIIKYYFISIKNDFFLNFNFVRSGSTSCFGTIEIPWLPVWAGLYISMTRHVGDQLVSVRVGHDLCQVPMKILMCHVDVLLCQHTDTHTERHGMRPTAGEIWHVISGEVKLIRYPHTEYGYLHKILMISNPRDKRRPWDPDICSYICMFVHNPLTKRGFSHISSIALLTMKPTKKIYKNY